MLSLKRISREASNLQTYTRGVEVLKAGKVTNVEQDWFDGYDIVRARVKGSGQEAYRVVVELDGEGDVADYECDCAAFENYDGACKHIVALLLHQFYADDRFSESLNIAHTLQARYNHVRTDGEAESMMRRYLNKEAVRLPGVRLSEGERVTLTPHIQFQGHRILVDFSIGNVRKYVIKDIRQFYQHMKNQDTVEYGKQLHFFHVRENFQESSLPLLDLILRHYEELEEARTNTLSYGAFPSKCIRLNSADLDFFFDLWSGKELEGVVSGKKTTFLLMDGTPKLRLKLHEIAGAKGIRLEYGDMDWARGRKALYIRQGLEIYRCDKAYTEAMEDFVAGCGSYKRSLTVAEGDISEFCGSVLQNILPFVELRGRTDLLERYMPQPMAGEIYLDAPQRDQITAKVVADYDGIKINLYEKTTGVEIKVNRDRLEEYRLRLAVEKYFHPSLHSSPLCYLERDDDAIYRFVTEGVSELAKTANLFATERFRNIRVIPPPKVNIGIRLETNLLNIDLDTGDFDLKDLGEILRGYRQNHKYYRLKDGRFFQMEEGTLKDLVKIAEGLGFGDKELHSGTVSVPSYRAMYLDKILREGENIRYTRDGYFKSLVKNMKAVEDSDFDPPESLVGVLRNYQKTGFRWLKTIEQYGFGGILADDMGLGKTLQIIALLLAEKEQGGHLPSLVVCPTSLVLNWESEIARFAPGLRTLVIGGSAAQRKEQIEQITTCDVALTSYDTLKRDVELYAGIQFRYHVIDEAQYIKNHNTQNAKAVKVIKSKQRFALTGTPIENRLSELWSIFDFLMPGFLYSYVKFRDEFEAPIVKEHHAGALERLGKMTAPFILRRLKKEVLRELPEKVETVICTSMETEQKKLYLANAVQLQQQIQKDVQEESFPQNKIVLLSMLTRLRQICCDPALCYENYTGGSGKLESCIDLLREAKDTGHKVLLFSQFTSMLAILQRRLEREGISFYVLQGSTPKEKRAALVEKFNGDGTDVFLISLKAGGTGLNLTGADIVIHYDPWWNVAAQNQATDRAHRIGQKHSVQVYRLIAKDTVEEKIIKLQEAKRDLADAVITEGGASIGRMTADELMDLLL